MNLANCPQCGKLYVKNSYNLCPNCLRGIEEQYQKCVDYLRRNRASTLHDLSEGTGVSIRQITKFIREGRIAPKDAPNVLTPCDTCGKPIHAGSLCETCHKRIVEDVHSLKQDERRKAERQPSADTYLKNRSKNP